MHALTPRLQCNNGYHAIHDAWIEKAMISEKLFSIIEKVFPKDVNHMTLLSKANVFNSNQLYCIYIYY